MFSCKIMLPDEGGREQARGLHQSATTRAIADDNNHLPCAVARRVLVLPWVRRRHCSVVVAMLLLLLLLRTSCNYHSINALLLFAKVGHCAAPPIQLSQGPAHTEHWRAAAWQRVRVSRTSEFWQWTRTRHDWQHYCLATFTSPVAYRYQKNTAVLKVKYCIP